MKNNLKTIYLEDNFQAFYTDAEEIRLLMLNLLESVGGKTILEPCAGEGSFIRGLNGTPQKVTAVDIDIHHIQLLNSIFPFWVETIHTDFIDQFISSYGSKQNFLDEKYDATICNPPYGLKFSVDYRKKIKKKFPSLYARESYGLFMHFAISLLKEGGRYVFIIPDTFLTSINHKPLRNFLVNEAQPTHIIQFKSKRFQTVNFGYGNLCIIAGVKKKLTPEDEVLWCDATKTNALIDMGRFKYAPKVFGEYFIEQKTSGWIHPEVSEKINFIYETTILDEVAECKTGIYTGDNNRFCAYDQESPPSRVNGHAISWTKNVVTSELSDEEKKNGVQGSRIYVPLIRGGHRSPFEITRHAVKWSNDAINFYDKDKKARLQNATYYFRSGLAIPMVTSGRISASFMSSAVFDQGVVGVFPREDKWLDFLLLYFNSDFVSILKKTINPSANNSANYLKRMPVPLVQDKDLTEAKKLVERSRFEGWKNTKSLREDFINKFTTS